MGAATITSVLDYGDVLYMSAISHSLLHERAGWSFFGHNSFISLDNTYHIKQEAQSGRYYTLQSSCFLSQNSEEKWKESVVGIF